MSNQIATQSTGYPSIFEDSWERTALILFVLEVVLLVGLSAVPLPNSVSSVLLAQYNSIKTSIYSQNILVGAMIIFLHNFLNATIEIIPFFGALWFLGSTAITGITVSAIAPSLGASGPFITLSLFLSPHSWLELPAYALSSTESIFMFLAFLGMSKVSLHTEFRRAVIVWAVVAVELLVAGVFESAEINLGTAHPLYILLAWIPFFIILALVLLYRHMAKKALRAHALSMQVAAAAATAQTVQAHASNIAVYPGTKKTKSTLKKRKTNTKTRKTRKQK